MHREAFKAGESEDTIHPAHANQAHLIPTDILLQLKKQQQYFYQGISLQFTENKTAS